MNYMVLESVSNMENNYISRREHDEFVRRMDDEHKRMNHRIITLENGHKQMQDLVNNVGKMAVSIENMCGEIHSQGKRLERLEEVPSKSWNTIKSGLYNAIGATIGGAVIAGIMFFM